MPLSETSLAPTLSTFSSVSVSHGPWLPSTGPAETARSVLKSPPVLFPSPSSSSALRLSLLLPSFSSDDDTVRDNSHYHFSKTVFRWWIGWSPRPQDRILRILCLPVVLLSRSFHCQGLLLYLNAKPSKIRNGKHGVFLFVFCSNARTFTFAWFEYIYQYRLKITTTLKLLYSSLLQFVPLLILAWAES